MTHQPIRKISHIIRRRTQRIPQISSIDTARIVLPGSLVPIAILGIGLFKPWASCRSFYQEFSAILSRCRNVGTELTRQGGSGGKRFAHTASIPNHPQNTPGSIRSVKARPIESLHDPRVFHAIIRIAHPHIATTLLHDNTQNNPGINAALVGYSRDR